MENHFDETTHTYYCNGVRSPSLHGVMAAAGFGLSPEDKVNPVIIEAMARGVAVHKATELLDNGTLDWSSVSNGVLPYLKAYTAFKDKHTPQMVSREIMVFSPTVSCRIDILARLDNELWLIDIKTGSSDIKDYKLQTAGNIHCMILANNGMEIPTRRGCLFIRKDGSYELKEHTDPKDFELFKACVDIFWFKNPKYAKKQKENQ